MTDPAEVMRVSAKAGIGIEDLLVAVIERVPAPAGNPAAPLKALIYNSHFDTYKGVVVYVRMVDGTIKPGQKIKFMRAGREYAITEMGQFRPGMEKCDELSAGQVGYFTANIKNIEYVNIGDTVTEAANPTAEPLAGYKEPKPMVYSGLFPVNNNEFEDLREALAKLKLNDSSFTFQPEVSDGLGFGFRCGFLGMLHRGNHSAAQGAGQQPEPRADRAERDVRDQEAGRRGDDRSRAAGRAGRGVDRRVPRADREDQFPDPGREHRQPDGDVYRPSRDVRAHGIPEQAARHSRVRDAARGGDLRPVR